MQIFVDADASKTEKEARDNLIKEEILQDDRFFFIAGYTSGGAPYGVTWEEMGLKPWEDLEKMSELPVQSYYLSLVTEKSGKTGEWQKNSPGSSESENVI